MINSLNAVERSCRIRVEAWPRSASGHRESITFSKVCQRQGKIIYINIFIIFFGGG